MSRVVHAEFEHGRRYVPPRPNVLRRVISRYQLIELFVIIGAIFLLWGGSSIARLPSIMNAAQPLAWLESFRVEIIDGDSIRSGGQSIAWSASTRRKAAQCQCERERVLAAKATHRLQAARSPAARSISGAFPALARAARKEPANAITAGFAPR